jgi:hypothetical protein
MERFSLSLLLSLVDIQIPPLPVERLEQKKSELRLFLRNNNPETKGRNPFQDSCLQHV